jgi:hypothetical protein
MISTLIVFSNSSNLIPQRISVRRLISKALRVHEIKITYTSQNDIHISIQDFLTLKTEVLEVVALGSALRGVKSKC